MFPTKYIILSGLFAAIMALLAQISIPIPFSPVPITGQTFGVFLTGAILGGRWGAVSMLTYIFIGAIGFPVFSFAQGGCTCCWDKLWLYLGIYPGQLPAGPIYRKRSPIFNAHRNDYLHYAIHFGSFATGNYCWSKHTGHLAFVIPFLQWIIKSYCGCRLQPGS